MNDQSLPRIASAIVPSGFTGHEHVDAVQLIHMNGRVYDFGLGRFLGVDPFIPFPMNSLSINPHRYILNNPLSGMDPTGYASEGANCKDGAISSCPEGSAKVQDSRSVKMGGM